MNTILKIYNTETKAQEGIVGPTIKLYTCGPTVYNFAHIGNFRTYVFEDLLKRSLKFFGMEVIHVQNITDVEDKILITAKEKGLTLNQLTEPYIKAFFEDLEILKVEKADFYPRATDYIPEMVEIIEKLLESGAAYRGPDECIYYKISTFPTYGRLSHLNLATLKPGASERLSADEYEKESVCDFVLWKSYDAKRDGEVFWETSLGKGRPGWHIECSAMAMKILGETIDIHVGGIDNMFPHHENEIAQCEAFSGKQFVRHWIHCEHLLVDQKKMSKSLGNFYTLRDLIKKGYKGVEIRYMLLHAHYRSTLNFTFEGLDGMVHSLERLSDFVSRLQGIAHLEEANTTSSGAVHLVLQNALREFTQSLADDLNISSALAALFEMVRQINALADQNKVSKKDAEESLKLLHRINQVLAILPLEAEDEEIPKDLQDLLEKRQEARKTKNWALSDQCRDQILSRGYLIEDTPAGARLKKKRELSS
ncbi:MAG: cysteine--tRNA ligase [Chlamydiales bacterium]|nr:cysteine--tRNA ligase [Chlamydiales bacterium]